MNHSTTALIASTMTHAATRSSKGNARRNTTRSTSHVALDFTRTVVSVVASITASTATLMWSLVAIGVTLIMAIVGLAGCSSSTHGDGNFTCAFGELSGTWRVHYEETNGNCGAIADETVVLGTAPDPAAASCTRAADVISQDKCRADEDFTCPTADNRGTQHWIGTLHHTATDRVSGSLTVQVNHPSIGLCRSTYDVIWTRQ